MAFKEQSGGWSVVAKWRIGYHQTGIRGFGNAVEAKKWIAKFPHLAAWTEDAPQRRSPRLSRRRRDAQAV